MAKHIVIIEDDEDIANTMAAMLAGQGYRVTCVTSFTDKEQLSHCGADLFFIDERLPAVSGHIICIMLRGYPATRNVPQVLMSASPLLQKFAELAEVNASLKKPFGMEELTALAAQLIGKA